MAPEVPEERRKELKEEKRLMDKGKNDVFT